MHPWISKRSTGSQSEGLRGFVPEYRSLLDQCMVESIAPELFFWRFFLHHQLLIKVFFYVQVGWLLVLDFLATW